MMVLEDLDLIQDVYGILAEPAANNETNKTEASLNDFDDFGANLDPEQSPSSSWTAAASSSSGSSGSSDLHHQQHPNGVNVFRNNVPALGVKNPTESQFFDFIFFFCSLLDLFIVQPMNFFTSDENVASLPFYFS